VAERSELTGLLDQLIDNADQALLTAKQWGRNRVIAYTKMSAHSTVLAGRFPNQWLDNITAADVMLPFTLSIQPHDSAKIVADYFLKTQFEMLPVTNHEGKLTGMISETDFIAMIGQIEHWVSPIKRLVLTNVASYPVDTPIRKIIDFLNRSAIRRVMIVRDKMLVGYICRSSLLRWLRNQWALMSGKHSDIIPDLSSRETFVNNLRTAAAALKEELVHLDEVITDNENTEGLQADHEHMVSVVSQCQDMMEQVLKYSSILTQNSSEIIPPS
jgi:CBS domain-containing protein